MQDWQEADAARALQSLPTSREFDVSVCSRHGILGPNLQKNEIFQYLSRPFIFFSAIHAKVRAVAETGGHAMSCFDIFYHFLSYNLHRAKALSEGHLSSILMHTSYRLKGQACPTTIETLRHSTSDFLLPYQAVGCRCSGYGREAGG